MGEDLVNALGQVADEPLALLFALLLGAVSAASSACCTLPTIGILLGYSGAQSVRDRRSAIRFSLTSTLGIVFSMMLIGVVAGFMGQVAQGILGKYWKLFADIVAIFFGLATLKALPFSLPVLFPRKQGGDGSWMGTTALGVLIGGGVAVTSLPCNLGTGFALLLTL